jgi:AcrR family transcriptional regulator
MDVKNTERTVHDGALNRVMPPRERILVAARELFLRHGVHGVGVETIAEAAGTNKMTLYRHFESKELLVAECLRGIAAEGEAIWVDLAEAHPGNPLAQVQAWLKKIDHHDTSGNSGACALVHAAIQLTDPNHPARKVIDESQRRHRANLVRLCCASGLVNPELLADQLFLLVEGARVSYRSTGENQLHTDFSTIAAAVIAAHRRPDQTEASLPDDSE